MTTDKTALDALLPCPFCGGEAQDYGQVEVGGAIQTRIGCQKCGARSPIWGDGNSQQAWNTRPQPRADVEQVEDIVTEAMQDIWNDWCADTGSIPCDFERKGRKTYFQAGKWASNVARQVQCRLAAQGYIGGGDGWREMSTIPDNLMSGVDLWDDREEKRYINCTFDLRVQAWADENSDFVKIPTHWMPLPAAPKKEGE